MSLLRVLLCFFSLLAWAQPPNPAAPAKLKVWLDPGHGGEDRGARGPKGLSEKEAALAIAQDLRDKLRAAGFEAVLGREDDRFIPVWDRAKKANEAGADLFLSLHLNAARAKGARGSEVYFLSLGQGDADAQAVAALENAGAERTPEGDSLVAGILDDLAQKAFLQDSERLAVAVLTQLNRLGGIRQRGVKQAPFAVLRSAAMPAVLVESAFISNPKEETKLRDQDFRKRIADAITRGIQRFVADGFRPVKRKAVEGKP
ncbi:MAG: N-acetylmuramoyl-L-alanine amidase [Acidobacteria bacterium]|nr:N-acetylmuramoyl-L-alanine amidase [Acidobacteriota bacterium]